MRAMVNKSRLTALIAAVVIMAAAMVIIYDGNVKDDILAMPLVFLSVLIYELTRRQ